MMTTSFAGLTDIGRIRRENQDHWFADPQTGLYLVADGMGGEVGGGLASQIVVEALPLMLRDKLPSTSELTAPQTGDQVIAAVVEMSNRLRQESWNQPGIRGLGSTLVLAVIRRDHAMIVHLGDSRAYFLRQGHLEQLTADHTIVQLLLNCGEIVPEEVATHPARGQLTRFVGMSEHPLPDLRLVELAAGDRLLLCSDGLTGLVPGEKIETVLREAASPQEACQKLVAAANEAGGSDNITALVVVVSGGDPASSP